MNRIAASLRPCQVTVQALLKTIRLLCITVSAGRSRSVKNAADTKLNQVGLNCYLVRKDSSGLPVKDSGSPSG